MTPQEFWARVALSTELPFAIEDVNYVQSDGMIIMKNDDHPYRISAERLPLPGDYRLHSSDETLMGHFKPDAE